MVRVTGEWATAFTVEELEKLVDRDLPMCAKLYGRPEEQVSFHQKKGLWQAITKKVRTWGSTTSGAHTAGSGGRT
ncbi:hypothetical protein NDU88_003377 [Pleurodeles waltl]|uniref:Uncharacterized protein n=1 Tax=Pleurodeles waltl TaxID=8319 RepID=A0AAV7M4C7_PLEWA|nr:hypothetical protein NDU88_003377 [Pleurodeles waltl]